MSIVIEAAFQDRLWRPHLEPLVHLANVRVIRCTAPAGIAHGRIINRLQESCHCAAHADQDLLEAIASGEHSLDSFVQISLEVPTLTVDTSHGYQPALADIASFVQAGDTRKPSTRPSGR
ncbi:hypothetical protein [Streptomyces abikoensis]|uniref:hypothetical protein n=1 Tax=Streptomyces abikoensis TaxID=97398 RepID=UPI0033EAA11E